MSIGQRANGSWYVQYRVPGEKNPRREYCGVGEEGRKKAKIRDAELKHVKAKGQNIEPLSGKIYLDSIAQAYLLDRKLNGKTERWLNDMAKLLNEHFLPKLCAKPAAAITYNEIIQLVSEKWGHCEPATRYRYMAYLKSIFKYGTDNEMIVKSPLAKWKKPKEKKRNLVLTTKDLEKLLANAAPHLVWAIQIEWELGVRPGMSELFKLRYDDIDWQRCSIHVKGTKTETSDRLLPITPEFRDMLLEHRKTNQSGYLIEYRGKPVTTLKTGLRRAAERAGLPYAPCLYEIRHLLASTLIANQGDLAAVSKLLGHASISTTENFYYHLLAGEMQRTITRKPKLKVKPIGQQMDNKHSKKQQKPALSRGHNKAQND